MRHRLFAILWLLGAVAVAADKPENWVEVRSPHFVVVTNANDKQGRNVADQFERMRSVFQAAFPKLAIDSFAPITVIAVKDEKNFRALEPEAYLAKGSLKLGGLFVHGTEKNYVLVRLESGYEHPWSIVYHEYTHLLTSKASEYMPLWLNEGFAEFYENTEILGKDVNLGQPSRQNIFLLREHKLLPLEQLFTIDHDSPYYHEQDKGSIFYAESWALTHYLTMNDYQAKTHRVRDYLDLLSQKVDAVTAATTAFGDLKQLQKALEAYVGRFSFQYFRMQAASNIDDTTFKVRTLSAPEASAVRADFLTYNRRYADARALLEQVMHDDPSNVSARETLGLIESQQGHIEKALKYYEEATKLDSQSYLAHYYYASMAMNAGADEQTQERVEASLRTAIKLNPEFAPAYDRLAVFYGMHRKNLAEAYQLSLHAVQRDPSNIFFRLNSANILMTSQRVEDAVWVLQAALKIAKNEAEKASVNSAIDMVNQYKAMRERVAQQNREAVEISAKEGRPVLRQATTVDEDPAPPTTASSKSSATSPPRGPHKTMIGRMTEVKCSPPSALEFKFQTSSGAATLRSQNYYRVQFTALGFTPEGELHPCSDLEGMQAKVEFVETADQTLQIVAVEMRK